MEGAWVLFISFVLSNPVFIYFISFIFEKDSTGSLVTRLVYIVLGGITPIILMILAVIPKTVET
jgi:hypothetical protein